MRILAAAAATLFQHFAEIQFHRAQGRRNPEQQSGNQRGHKGEYEHRHVNLHIGRCRNIGAAERHQTPNSPDGQQRSERSAENRKHDALGNHLSHDAQSSGAQRAANSNLLLPGRSMGHQKVGDVRTGNQQYQCDCAQQNV